MDHITANAETLMQQASMTASEYLREAIRRIDDQLGAGYAEKNPALIGTFMAAAAQDFATSMAAAVRQDESMALSAISNALEGIAQAITELPLGE